MILQELEKKGLINPPKWLSPNCQYLTICGSMAYSTNTNDSDFDVYGWVIPPLSMVFPHTTGTILNFGTQPPQFESLQKHHVFDKDALGGKGREYDFCIYGIVKFFNLAMAGNPTVVDSLFTAANCLLHCTPAGQLVRDNRKLFLSKEYFIRCRAYGFSQLHKMTIKEPIGKRKEDIEKHGFDLKFASNLVRLLSQAEQVLTTGDLDLQQNKEHLKAIRRGEVSEANIRQWAADKELQLENLCAESKLIQESDEEKIKTLLLNVLEMHYGSLDKVIYKPKRSDECIDKIKEVLQEYGV